MTPTPPDAVRLPQQGDVIAGKYQVEEVLGQGGMGVVVAARHLALRQRVAVKFLLPAGLRVPGARERFLREAQAAAALQSEHVARVLDVGALETGEPYLVMEYLSGTDISRLLKSHGPLPIALAVDLILQACEAISEAHALGIVHRDLKPQNLFVVSRSGAPFVKVLDFGLSKVPIQAGDARGISLTATGLVMGSPQYMSPEQIRSLKHVDARTDLWALGVILYQLIAGRRPFVGDSMIAVFASVMTDLPLPLKGCRPEVPAKLDALVQRCLEKDPARRIQSVDELVRGLLPFAPAKARILAEPAEQVSAGATAKPSQASISAVITSIPDLTSLPYQTTERLSAERQTEPWLRQEKVARIVALAAVAVISVFAFGVMLTLQTSQGQAVQAAPPAEQVEPVLSRPAVTPADDTRAPPPSAKLAVAALLVAPSASACASSVTSSSRVPSPLRSSPQGSAEASAKVSPTPPSSITAMPAATSNPAAGKTPKAKTTNDIVDPYK